MRIIGIVLTVLMLLSCHHQSIDTKNKLNGNWEVTRVSNELGKVKDSGTGLFKAGNELFIDLNNSYGELTTTEGVNYTGNAFDSEEWNYFGPQVQIFYQTIELSLKGQGSSFSTTMKLICSTQSHAMFEVERKGKLFTVEFERKQ